MGGRLSLPDVLTGNGSYQVIMLGLDNAGKSTTLYHLKCDRYVHTDPTIGFNCETLKSTTGTSRGCAYHVWDVGGQEKLRPLWKAYVRHTDALIYVVDSTDTERMDEARVELLCVMRSNDMPPCTPLIVLANKQDLPRALTVDTVHARMGVAHVPNAYQPMTLGCCAVSGDGLETLLDSLHSVIVTSRRQRQTTAAASSGGGEAKQRSSGRNS